MREELPVRTKRVRVWLRLLATANLIEGRLRTRLADGFDISMPRFDALAQLARHPDGMTMTALSRRMMVTKGNISALVERLVEDGLVERMAVPGDRRSTVVRLSPAGKDRFSGIAPTMEAWVVELFSGLDDAEIDALANLLARLKEDPS